MSWLVGGFGCLVDWLIGCLAAWFETESYSVTLAGLEFAM